MRTKPTKRFWASYNALYGEPATLVAPKVKKPCLGEKKAVKSEDEEQFAVANWLRKENIPFYHVPNQRMTSVRYGAKLKRLGVSSGVPDLVITRMRKGYGALYVELKRIKGGKVSETQIEWKDVLLREGYAWFVAYGAEDAINIVKDYLGYGE